MNVRHIFHSQKARVAFNPILHKIIISFIKCNSYGIINYYVTVFNNMFVILKMCN